VDFGPSLHSKRCLLLESVLSVINHPLMLSTHSRSCNSMASISTICFHNIIWRRIIQSFNTCRHLMQPGSHTHDCILDLWMRFIKDERLSNTEYRTKDFSTYTQYIGYIHHNKLVVEKKSQTFLNIRFTWWITKIDNFPYFTALLWIRQRFDFLEENSVI
jgi:hypothetical protein